MPFKLPTRGRRSWGNKMSAYPTVDEVLAIIDENIKKLLGIIDETDYEVKKGCLIIRKEFVHKPISFNKHFPLKNNLPQGGRVRLNFSTLSAGKKQVGKNIDPSGWPSPHYSLKGEYLCNRGHILAHELACKASYINTSRSKYTNIFTQSLWANRSNHENARFGYNQSFFENCLKNYLIANPLLNIDYYVKLIYCENDIIPRGVLIRGHFLEKKKQLNVFVPNIDSRYIINYETANFTEK